MVAIGSWQRGCFLFALVALVGAAVAGEARAEQPTGSVGAEKLVEKRHEWHVQKARLDAAEEEVRRIMPARVSAAKVANFKDPTPVLTELRPTFTEDYKSLRNAANKIAENSRIRRDDSKKEWGEIYRQRIALRQYADQQQAAYGFDFDTGSQRELQPSFADVGAIVWAVVVFLVARRLGQQVRRVSMRQARRAAAAVVLLSLFTMSGCSHTPAPDERPWTVREDEKLTDDVRESTEKADVAVAEANKKWTATLDGWAALVHAPGVPGDPVEGILRDGENDVRKTVQEAAVNARVAERLIAEAEVERTQLEADKAKLGSLTSSAKWRAVAFATARCTGIALLFGLAIAPFWRARRKETAAIRADAKKCPRCFSTKLIVEKNAVVRKPDQDGGRDEEEDFPQPLHRGTRTKPKPKKAKKSDEGEQPEETGYVECKSCSFRFLRSYQHVRRLCFPVVGVPNSGKTHMLATGYDRVRKRTAPTVAVVQPAPSLGDVRFEQYIDLILNMKQVAGNTVHDVRNPPDPVMLHVRDADPVGPNTALVNLFDYSGELVNQNIDKDRLKKQAVLMDGFMLFLDPTQLYGDGANVTLDRQLSALNEFMADMREARGVPLGQVIPVPVAVCITKFDLLVTENPIQSQSVPFIRQLLAKMNPPPKETTIGTIRKRSETVEDMLELIFRGVDIRALVESYFGPQVMFFPVSSVSLFENELGIKDLSRRTIAPFGVAEPFLWLLHMHGYEIFA